MQFLRSLSNIGQGFLMGIGAMALVICGIVYLDLIPPHKQQP